MPALSDATAKLFTFVELDKGDIAELTVSNDLTKFTVSLYQEETDRFGKVTRYQPSRGAKAFAERLPGCKKVHAYQAAYAVECGAVDITAELFSKLWPAEQLFFFDENSLSVYESLLTKSFLGDYAAEMIAEFKDRGKVPQHSYELCADYPLAPYQQIGLLNCMHNSGYCLFMEPGTGKTPVGIATVCNMVAEQRASGNKQPLRAIIVCPNNARMNWQKEFEKFSTRQGKVTVLRGPEIGRVKQLIDAMTIEEEGDEFTVVICGFETMSRSWEALRYIPWDVSIIDEGHGIRNVKTQRYKTALNLRDISNKRILLTGSAVCNSALDLYGQLEFTGSGNSGFPDWDSYRRFYGVYQQNDSGSTSLVGIQNLPFLQERLARQSYIVSLKEVLPDLPEKVYDIYEIEMGAKQSAYYEELAEKLYIEIEEDFATGTQPREMLVNNALTKLLKLAQITSGFISWDETVNEYGQITSKKDIEYFTPNPKIEAVLDLLAEKGPNDKTIIWASWNADIDYLSHAIHNSGYGCVTFRGSTNDNERAVAEDRFNNDAGCKVFIGNGAAGGTALNLLGYPPGKPEATETNCNHVIYYSQNWSQVVRTQSEARANRRGTRVPTRITDLVVPNTIDEEIRARVIAKQLHALEVHDLRAILKNVLKGSH